MKTCQVCANSLSPADLAVDPYTNLCRACWTAWQVEAGTPLTRYGKPGTVCTSCGMMFGGVRVFDWHRHQGRCLSPTRLMEKHPELKIKNGVWARPSPENGKITNRDRQNGDFPSAGIPEWHPTHENA